MARARLCVRGPARADLRDGGEALLHGAVSPLPPRCRLTGGRTLADESVASCSARGGTRGERLAVDRDRTARRTREPTRLDTDRRSRRGRDRDRWLAGARHSRGGVPERPPEQRASAVVLTGNYGEAGAIDRYGPALGLPRASRRTTPTHGSECLPTAPGRPSFSDMWIRRPTSRAAVPPRRSTTASGWRTRSRAEPCSSARVRASRGPSCGSGSDVDA